MNQNKKSRTVRIRLEYYNHLKETGAINKRSLGGQIYWICDVISSIQENDPDYYAKVTQQLNDKEKSWD